MPHLCGNNCNALEHVKKGHSKCKYTHRSIRPRMCHTSHNRRFHKQERLTRKRNREEYLDWEDEEMDEEYEEDLGRFSDDDSGSDKDYASSSSKRGKDFSMVLRNRPSKKKRKTEDDEDEENALKDFPNKRILQSASLAAELSESSEGHSHGEEELGETFDWVMNEEIGEDDLLDAALEHGDSGGHTMFLENNADIKRNEELFFMLPRENNQTMMLEPNSGNTTLMITDTTNGKRKRGRKKSQQLILHENPMKNIFDIHNSTDMKIMLWQRPPEHQKPKGLPIIIPEDKRVGPKPYLKKEVATLASVMEEYDKTYENLFESKQAAELRADNNAAYNTKFRKMVMSYKSRTKDYGITIDEDQITELVREDIKPLLPVKLTETGYKELRQLVSNLYNNYLKAKSRIGPYKPLITAKRFGVAALYVLQSGGRMKVTNNFGEQTVTTIIPKCICLRDALPKHQECKRWGYYDVKADVETIKRTISAGLCSLPPSELMVSLDPTLTKYDNGYGELLNPRNYRMTKFV